jgi:hypothetical protein
MGDDTQDFQNVGEPYRQQLGIDGTAGDAQDKRHPYTEDERYPGACIVCGLSRTYNKHQ